jgi:signal transduction histidine kinase
MYITNLSLALLTLTTIFYLLDLEVILKRRSFREKGISLLLAYMLLSALWTLSQTLPLIIDSSLLPEVTFTHIYWYELLALSLLLVHLTRLFLRLPGLGRGWWGAGLTWLLLTIIFNENLLNLPDVLWTGNGWLVTRQQVGLGMLILGWAGATGSAAFLALRAYYRTHQPLHRNRISYWFAILFFTGLGALLFFNGYQILGDLFHLLGALGLTYVMLTYRLRDVRQMARRTVSYLIVTLLTMMIYAIGILASQSFSQSSFGYAPFIIVGLVALILALIFDPLLRFVQQLVNQVISGVGYDATRALRGYSADISNILDLERLATVVLGTITKAVEIRHGALFIVRQDTAQAEEALTAENGELAANEDVYLLHGVLSLGPGLQPGLQPPSGALASRSPVVQHLRLERQPLTQYDIDLMPHFQHLAPPERAWLNSLNMDLYVPIHAKGEWIGLLTFGPKISGDRYFDEDLTLIGALADQTAVALENARLFDDFKMRNIEIERLNQELTKANRQLAQLDQAKSNFIGVASHELRTPLTHIRGYNDMLADMLQAGGLTPDAGLRMTQAVSKGVQRLEAIVNTMFDVSKIDTETLDLSVTLISPKSIVQMAADGWAEALKERNQTLTIEALDDLPSIVADGDRLRQIFSQLIQNAIKFTPDGGRIEISGRHLLDDKIQPPDDGMVEMIVADTGIGIAAEDLDHVFDKFYRTGSASLHSTGQTKFKGAGPGLGLTIARGVVEAHGGRIWVESPGYDEERYPGSRFHVLLPVRSSRLALASAAFMVAPIQATD